MAGITKDVVDGLRAACEAQQARLSQCGATGLVDIDSDSARLPMRRTVERLLAEEEGALAAE